MKSDSEHEQYEGTQCTGGIFGSTRPALSGAGPKVTYIPPPPPEDEDSMFAHYQPGRNFDKYDCILAEVSGRNAPPPILTFNEANLCQTLNDNIAKAGYSKLTPVQEYGIPVTLAGRDLIACAQTGSGKTDTYSCGANGDTSNRTPVSSPDSEHEQYEGTQCTGGIFGSTRPALSGAGPKVTYIPPPPPEDEDSMFAHYQPGRNFDKYDCILAEVSGRNAPPPILTFKEANLCQTLNDNIAKAGYSKLTPVQKYSIPVILAGRDLIACAQTGSGKTAAFLLPILAHMMSAGITASRSKELQEPECIIVAPTRELIRQIYLEARKFSFG
ncbi:putative ATP-dependent RNA helicase DDX4, partial [Manis javanica]